MNLSISEVEIEENQFWNLNYPNSCVLLTDHESDFADELSVQDAWQEVYWVRHLQEGKKMSWVELGVELQGSLRRCSFDNGESTRILMPNIW